MLQCIRKGGLQTLVFSDRLAPDAVISIVRRRLTIDEINPAKRLAGDARGWSWTFIEHMHPRTAAGQMIGNGCPDNPCADDGYLHFRRMQRRIPAMEITIQMYRCLDNVRV